MSDIAFDGPPDLGGAWQEFTGTFTKDKTDSSRVLGTELLNALTFETGKFQELCHQNNIAPASAKALAEKVAAALSAYVKLDNDTYEPLARAISHTLAQQWIVLETEVGLFPPKAIATHQSVTFAEKEAVILQREALLKHPQAALVCGILRSICNEQIERRAANASHKSGGRVSKDEAVSLANQLFYNTIFAHDPALGEFVDYLSVSLRRALTPAALQELIRESSLEVPVMGGDKELGSTLPNNSVTDPEHEAIQREELARLRLALEQCTPYEQGIIKRLHGMDGEPVWTLEELRVHYDLRQAELNDALQRIRTKLKHILSLEKNAGAPVDMIIPTAIKHRAKKCEWVTPAGAALAGSLPSADNIVEAVAKGTMNRADGLRILVDRSGLDAIQLSRQSGVSLGVIKEIYKDYAWSVRHPREPDSLRLASKRECLEKLGRVLGVSEHFTEIFVEQFCRTYKSGIGGRKDWNRTMER